MPMERIICSYRRSNVSRVALATAALAAVFFGAEVHAQAVVRSAGVARTSVHATNVHTTNVTNVNVNRNVNVVHYDSWGHPLATAAAVTATAIAVGTIVASLPPSCTTVVTAGVTYQNCGGTFYQPMYQGSSVQYVVVNAP